MPAGRPTAHAAIALVLSTMLAAPAGAQMAACEGGVIELNNGSSTDFGWSGNAHDDDLVTGASFGFLVTSRCADDDAACTIDDDCGGSACVASCDCETDTTCEIGGPAGEQRCRTSLERCEDSRDCPAGVPCVSMASPPMPMSNGEVPVCIVSSFDAPLSGTLDTASGAATLSTTLRWRVFLGVTIAAPCPTCGTREQDPSVGDSFQCSGGGSSGQPCTVDGVTEQFGGVSFDCPPSSNANVSGSGIVVRLAELTTGTVSRTAKLPCGSRGFLANPLNAPEDPGVCLDDQSPCDTNADCTRCSGDPTIACSDDGDCAGKGSCAEAPDQPISCGYWCHCGYCNGDTSVACFDDSECPDGQACQPGEGLPHSAFGPQQRPNECAKDNFVCGELEAERCATTMRGECSEDPFRECTADPSVCQDFAAGTCVMEERACFEPSITRSGNASALGSYCETTTSACDSNADCSGEVCVDDALAPELTALTCSPGSGSALVNREPGVTGPVAIEMDTLIRLCRCAGSDPDGCDDVCSARPGCSAEAESECGSVCGDWSGNGVLTTNDALGVLRAAVGVHACALSVCDFDGSGTVTADDALAVLRAAISLPSHPACPDAATALRLRSSKPAEAAARLESAK